MVATSGLVASGVYDYTIEQYNLEYNLMLYPGAGVGSHCAWGLFCPKTRFHCVLLLNSQRARGLGLPALDLQGPWLHRPYLDAHDRDLDGLGRLDRGLYDSR
jgi:hypothetical protein